MVARVVRENKNSGHTVAMGDGAQHTPPNLAPPFEYKLNRYIVVVLRCGIFASLSLSLFFYLFPLVCSPRRFYHILYRFWFVFSSSCPEFCGWAAPWWTVHHVPQRAMLTEVCIFNAIPTATANAGELRLRKNIIAIQSKVIIWAHSRCQCTTGTEKCLRW